jgi:diguanylate cyclase (GGDEF)-like protein
LPFYIAMGMILGHRYWQNFRDATTDRLTGLMQRHYFLHRLEVELERARRQRGNLVVAMIDLDGFKAVNDTYSHQAGDLLLKEVTCVLRAGVRPFDLAGRFGGDELCLAMVVEDPQVAIELLGRVRGAVAAHRVRLGDDSVGVTASIGAAMCEVSQRTDLDLLLAAADDALYRAKADGGNCVRTAKPRAGE